VSRTTGDRPIETDSVLVAPRVVDDDARARAFTVLAEHALDRAYRLAAVILTDALEAEDAVADAALAAWRSFGSLDDPARFDAWFGRIVLNGCRDRLRRRKRRPIVDLGAMIETLPDDRSSADVSTAHAERDAIGRAVTHLDPDHQVVLALRFWADLDVETIAQRLGIPTGTVKSRLHSALRRLRQALDDETRPR